MTALAPHISAFLGQHLPRDRRASRHTIESYAVSFQLLVCFAADRLGVRPCQIEIEQLDVPLIPRLPRFSGAGAGQRNPHAQSATRGVQILLQVLGTSGSGLVSTLPGKCTR